MDSREDEQEQTITTENRAVSERFKSHRTSLLTAVRVIELRLPAAAVQVPIGVEDQLGGVADEYAHYESFFCESRTIVRAVCIGSARFY